MAQREYLDFDLAIETNDDGRYFSRVIASPAGEASSGFVFPFNALELENYLLKLGPTRPVVRRIDSPHVHTARQFGSALYQSVFSDDVGTTYLRSLDAAQREGKGLRLRMRLSEAPDLSGLPWEFLHDEGIGDFLVLSERRPLVRYPELPTVVEPLGVEAPLQILLIVSSPSDHVQLDVDREQTLLREALAGPIADGRVEVTLLEQPTLSSLRSALRRSEVHILHYIGHGGFDNQTDEGVVLFEDEQGKGRRVSASSLGTILYDHDPLRLVVLNACEGARTGMDDPFSGVAPELVRRGAPAVIAMQFEITDQAAITFGHEFYLAIADGYPVDAATASARKAIFAEGNGLEWATPVLYLRSPDGMIFDLQQPSPPVERAMTPMTERDDAESDLSRPDEEQEEDSHPDVLTADDQAKLRAAALAATLERASHAMETSEWEQAIRLFQDVLTERPEDEKASQGLARATTELEKHEMAHPPEKDDDGPPNNRLWLMLGGLAVVVLAIVFATINLSTDEGSETTTTSVEVSTPDATYLAAGLIGPPAIDGGGEEWASITPYRTLAVAEGGDPDPGTESSWRFGWDEDALYLFVEVTDPDPLTTPNADEPAVLFRGDGVNFIFGPDPTGLPEDVGLRDGEDAMILIGPASPAAEDAVAGKRVRGVSSPENAGANDCENTSFVSGAEPEVDASVIKTEVGYNVEAAVPWEELFVAPPPAAGAEFGIIFTVAHAGDGSEDNRRGSRSSHASRAEAKHCPGRWGETIGLAAP